MKAWRITFEGIVFLMLGALMAVAGLVMLTGAETYQGIARIKVPPPNQAYIGPYFIQTEFEVIQSEVVLGKVIEKLHLKEQWGRKRPAGQILTDREALELLKRQMELRPIANTDLIEIRIFSGDPAEAAKIANTVAETFQDYRRETIQRWRNQQDKAGPGLVTNEREIRDPVVNIVDSAVVARRPIRPNRPLCATILLFGALLMILFLHGS